MSYDANTNEVASASTLSAPERHEYPISKVADREGVCSVADDSGWALLVDDGGVELCPVWRVQSSRHCTRIRRHQSASELSARCSGKWIGGFGSDTPSICSVFARFFMLMLSVMMPNLKELTCFCRRQATTPTSGSRRNRLKPEPKEHGGCHRRYGTVFDECCFRHGQIEHGSKARTLNLPLLKQRLRDADDPDQHHHECHEIVCNGSKRSQVSYAQTQFNERVGRPGSP